MFNLKSALITSACFENNMADDLKIADEMNNVDTSDISDEKTKTEEKNENDEGTFLGFLFLFIGEQINEYRFFKLLYYF